jgi:preprotein translocase subunit SecB
LETDRKVDLKAVARIAQRVDLRNIRLAEIAAFSFGTAQGVLEADLTHDCEAMRLETADVFEVICRYDFTVKTSDAEVASAKFNFVILYRIAGEEEVAEPDLAEFAFANGTYHSWPFVRQLLFDLTARMGYPPYTLPVLKFNPKDSVRVAEPVEEGVKSDPSSPIAPSQPSEPTPAVRRKSSSRRAPSRP